MWTNMWSKCCLLLLWLYCVDVAQLWIFDETGSNFPVLFAISLKVAYALGLMRIPPPLVGKNSQKFTYFLPEGFPYMGCTIVLVAVFKRGWKHLILNPIPNPATNSLCGIFDAVYISCHIPLSTWHIGMSVGEIQISSISKIFCCKTLVQREFCIVNYDFCIFRIGCKITFQRESFIEHISPNIILYTQALQLDQVYCSDILHSRPSKMWSGLGWRGGG